MILGFDTATPATAVAVLAPDGAAFEERDDPAAGERPGHAARLLDLTERALARAGAGWEDLERLAVGVGPGGFTGLRIGIATARALAQARELPLVAVGSLEALALGAAAHAGPGRTLLAVLDARRGEAFAAAWERGNGDGLGRCLLEPAALAPEALAAATRSLPSPALAAGDGAIRFRAQLEAAGGVVPDDGDACHRLSAVQVCRLGAAKPVSGRDALLPDYRREPDARAPTP